MHLPQALIVDENRKLKFGLLGGLFFYSAYWITNNVTTQMDPLVLELWWMDQAAPFWPATQWIYHFEVPFLIYSFFSFKTTRTRSRFFWCMMSLIVVCSIFFLIYPTTYPRDLFPIDPNESFSARALLFFRENIDQATNCLPSLHVATCYLVGFAYVEESKKRAWFSFIVATLIAISTLTTKQHYFIDVYAGLILTTGIWYGIGKKIQC